MLFQDRHEFSLLPKCLVLAAISGAVIAAWWMMFPWTDPPPAWIKPYLLQGDGLRRGLVLFCLVFYALRVMVTALVFLKRKLVWLEALTIASFMSVALLAYARAGGANPAPVGMAEVLGMALYLAGSWLNTWSEYQRMVFKADPANQGKLYTKGLFGLSRHINYTGDVVLFAGLALVAGKLFLLQIPLIMFLIFALILMPRQRKYLAKKYGEEFEAYCQQTKRIIPYVY